MEKINRMEIKPLPLIYEKGIAKMLWESKMELDRILGIPDVLYGSTEHMTKNEVMRNK